VIEIAYPAEPTYWIASCDSGPAAGKTKPQQVTTFGPQWGILLQTTDEAEWLAECERLGIEV
jgi:hypothetical protein